MSESDIYHFWEAALKASTEFSHFLFLFATAANSVPTGGYSVSLGPIIWMA